MNELVIRGARILSLDPATLDLPAGDIHIRDGAIAEVAAHVHAPAADVIEGRGTIAIPGFVDSHDHLWGALLRGLVGDVGATTWFPQKARFGPLFTPEDQYVAVRLALAEAVAGGVTTVHNWAHNINSPADADANLRAHAEAGLRARFSYGTPSTHPGLSLDRMAGVMGQVGRRVDDAMDLDDLARIAREWRSRDARVTIGAALRGPSRSPAAVYRAEFAAARELGIPITMHCAGTREEVERIRQVEVLAADGLLGPDLQLVHCNHVSARERELIAAHGVSVSMSPVGELRLAMGVPQLSEMLDAGITVSLSFDASAIAGSADMFAAMRLVFGLERVRTGRVIDARTLLQLATIGGARDLGLDAVTGSLTPGKRADIVLVRADSLGMAPGPGDDTAAAIVHSAQPADVDTVLVDGVVMKRGGALVGLDAERIVAEAAAARERLVSRAGVTEAAAAAVGRVVR